MRVRTTLVAMLALCGAVYFAVPSLTGRSWAALLSDAEKSARDVTTSSVRPPTPTVPAPAQAGGVAPVQVSVSQPVRREIVDYVEITGRFEAPESVDLRARVSGYLQDVLFKDGQDVAKGDTLFIIDPRPYERALALSKAELEQAKTRISNASLDVERARGLVQRRIVSEKTFDDRENLQREAEALAKVAEERVKTAELDLSFTRITAPVSGRIGRALITPGNYVAAAGGNASVSTLATIVVQDPIYVYFDISEADALKYKRMVSASGSSSSLKDILTGAAVDLQLADETAFMHTGKVDFIDNRLDTGTGSLRARAVLDNRSRLFTPGQFARVRLKASKPYVATLVPDSAIGADQANRFVMVLGADDTVARKPVVLGSLVEGMRVVREGLAGEDWVVTKGLARVRPGQKVMPKREALQVSSGTPPLVPVTR